MQSYHIQQVARHTLLPFPLCKTIIMLHVVGLIKSLAPPAFLWTWSPGGSIARRQFMRQIRSCCYLVYEMLMGGLVGAKEL
jgi:hypothetical protein